VGSNPTAGTFFPYKTYSEEELRAAVVASRSMSDVVLALGRTVGSSVYRSVKHQIDSYGISIEHFKGQGYKEQVHNRRSIDEILTVLPEDVARRLGRAPLHRALQARGVLYACRDCGNLGVWRDEELTLEIEHVDGNWRNNCIENLCYLCPNCHAQTPTYKNKTRGGIPSCL
jgi:hypothetical protein